MEIVNFLRDNWQYISFCLVIIFELLIIIIKKRPKKWDELNMVIQQAIAKIPGFIADAEQAQDLSGNDKKTLVIGWLLTFIENVLKRNLTNSEEIYTYKALSFFIEEVLTCPTKKGGFGREDEDA